MGHSACDLSRTRVAFTRQERPNLKGRLFTRGLLPQTAILRKQWASGILSETVDLIK